MSSFRPFELSRNQTHGHALREILIVRSRCLTWRVGRASGDSLDTSEFLKDDVQVLPLDKLHCVKMVIIVSANFEYRHDICVVQSASDTSSPRSSGLRGISGAAKCLSRLSSRAGSLPNCRC